MTVNNYFKVARRGLTLDLVFFDDRNLPETEAAYARACKSSLATAGTVSVWTEPHVHGMWRNVEVIR